MEPKSWLLFDSVGVLVGNQPSSQVAEKSFVKGLCQHAGACHNKMPRTGWLQQLKFIFAQFWRLKVQNQGAGRVGFW